MNKGFTLVELVVVITIIGILSTVGLSIYNGVSKNSQNTKKKADVDAIYQSYELTFDTTTKRYKTLTVSDFTSGAIPTPHGGGSYTFVYGPNSTPIDLTRYKVCASLVSSVPSCNTTSTTCYCRTSERGN
jgi:prepilin-type N-terminal cleavage/methylation domain-containing protein